MHFFYIIMLVIYTHVIYIDDAGDEDSRKFFTIMLAIGILYPAGYDITQMFRGGLCDYFADFWNYADLIYIWSSIANVILQNVLEPFNLWCKFLMITIYLLALIKTFFFLRIFSQLSPIVNMLTNVVYDLRIFLLFYCILITLFSLLLGILGIGNKYIEGGFKNAYGDKSDYPGKEYENIGLFLGNWVTTLRMSMGDFGFD